MDICTSHELYEEWGKRGQVHPRRGRQVGGGWIGGGRKGRKEVVKSRALQRGDKREGGRARRGLDGG